MSELERWEREAEAFYQATGFLRPGKDVPAAMNPSDEYMEHREVSWQAWCAAKSVTAARIAELERRLAEAREAAMRLYSDFYETLQVATDNDWPHVEVSIETMITWRDTLWRVANPRLAANPEGER